MASKKKSTIQVTRKGLMVWTVLFFFIAGWMFVLGILVGRGTAPVNLDMGRLEKELADLKATLLRNEKQQLESQAGGQKDATTELEFYEALKKTQPSKSYKIAQKPVPKPTPPDTVSTKPAPKPPPKPKVSPETKAGKTAEPVEAKKPSTSSPPPQVKKSNFTIQVAAFQSATNSQRMVNQLRKKGFPAYQIETPGTNGGKALHRVRVGAFENRSSAAKMLAKLKAQSVKGIVVATR
jgi:cell division septation protein DedD